MSLNDAVRNLLAFVGLLALTRATVILALRFAIWRLAIITKRQIRERLDKERACETNTPDCDGHSS